MTLVLITERDKSLRAFEAFQSAFQSTFSIAADVVRGCCLGWHGGNVEADVYWYETIRVWGVFRKRPPQAQPEKGNRFWNCFGVSQSRPSGKLNITVEINPPHKGENRRTSGAFLLDEEDHFYVGHSGRLGGNYRGMTIQEFREFSNRLPRQEITTPRGTRELITFGPLEVGELPGKLAPFVHTVAEFKKCRHKTPTG